MPIPTKDNYRLLVTSATGMEDKDFQIIQFYRYLIAVRRPNMYKVNEYSYEKYNLGAAYVNKLIIIFCRL